MKPIALGDPLPALDVTTTNNQTINLASFKGRPVILYFYPKDNTPGCTLEGRDFRDLHAKFNARNAVIFGVSRDSIKSHERFKEKQCFPFELISDPDEKLCQHFDVIKEKALFGIKALGLVRSTFLFDKKGQLHKAWRKVSVKGHAAEVLAAVESL